MSRSTRIIVVGTGRCGSTSLCEWLNRCGLVARMEPRAPELVVQQRRLIEGPGFDPYDIFDVALNLPQVEAVVDNNLSFFVRMLLELDGALRAIWLIRNPWDCVASMVGWKWYRQPNDIMPDDIFARNRLHAPWTGEMTWAEWDALPVVGRCAWCWSYVNRSIRQQLRAVPLGHWMQVRLEDWDDQKAREVYQFVDRCFQGSGVGIREPDDLSLPRTNQGPLPPTRPGGPPTPRPDWTEDERVLLRRFAGGMMEHCYPDWPEPCPSEK